MSTSEPSSDEARSGTVDLAPAEGAHGIEPAPHADAAAQGPAQSAKVAKAVPYILVAGVAGLLFPLRVAQGPIVDVDLYWHLLLGRELLDGTPVSLAGRGWTFSPAPDTWVSTQWLSELLFARLEMLGGLQALVVYRTVTYILAMAVLALVTLYRRPVRAGIWPFVAASLTMAAFAQERSQQITFVLAPLVGWWIERLWREGRLPRWWIVLPLTVVWANVHGGWVLIPFGLVLAAFARLLDDGWRDVALRKALLLALGSVLASCISPSGIDNALSGPRFAAAAVAIEEWQKVRPLDRLMIPALLLAVIVVVAWTRGKARPSRGELAVVACLTLFSLYAWRNVTPALLVLAPILTGTLSRALGDPDPREEPARLWRVALGLGVLGALMGIAFAVLQPDPVGEAVPQRLIGDIRGATSPQRVLDDYNVAGAVLWFGGGPGHAKVAIDGRADRYGADLITDYGNMLAAMPGWEAKIDALRPTCALLTTDSALPQALVSQRGWVEVGREGKFTLLRAPDAPGWQSG